MTPMDFCAEVLWVILTTKKKLKVISFTFDYVAGASTYESMPDLKFARHIMRYEDFTLIGKYFVYYINF